MAEKPHRPPILLISFTATFVLAIVAAFIFVPGLRPTPADPSLEITSRFRPYRSSGMIETGNAFDTATLELGDANEIVLLQPHVVRHSEGGGLTYRIETDPGLSGRVELFLRKALRVEESQAYHYGASGIQVTTLRHQIRVWRRDSGPSITVAIHAGVFELDPGLWITVYVRVPKDVKLRKVFPGSPEFATFDPTNQAMMSLNLWREVKQTPVPKDDFPK